MGADKMRIQEAGTMNLFAVVEAADGGELAQKS